LPEATTLLDDLADRLLQRLVILSTRVVMQSRPVQPDRPTGPTLATAQVLDRILRRGTTLLGP
jgi:hypothetical protein